MTKKEGKERKNVGDRNDYFFAHSQRVSCFILSPLRNSSTADDVRDREGKIEEEEKERRTRMERRKDADADEKQD